MNRTSNSAIGKLVGTSNNNILMYFLLQALLPIGRHIKTKGGRLGEQDDDDDIQQGCTHTPESRVNVFGNYQKILKKPEPGSTVKEHLRKSPVSGNNN